MTDNAADRKSVRKKEKAARQAELRRQQVVRELMSTRDGREWVWDKIADCGVFSKVSIGDPHMLAMFTGHRNAGVDLLNEVMLFCPDNFILAMRENNERHAPSDTDRRSDGDDSGAREEDIGDDLYNDSAGGEEGRAH